MILDAAAELGTLKAMGLRGSHSNGPGGSVCLSEPVEQLL